MFEGALVMETVGLVLFATKLYHTSAELVSPQNAEIPAVAVAFTPLNRSVPPVFMQDVPEFNTTAFEHASLPGCANYLGDFSISPDD